LVRHSSNVSGGFIGQGTSRNALTLGHTLHITALQTPFKFDLKHSQVYHFLFEQTVTKQQVTTLVWTQHAFRA
jgi:hypothetical protein